MNEKKQPTSLNGGIHLNKIPYKLNQLPYKPTITLAVDKLTQNIIGFSIQETPIAQNIQIHFAGNPSYFHDDSSPDLSTASYVKAMKKYDLQPKLVRDNTVVQGAKIERILTAIFLTLSQSLHGNPRPSPKNHSFGELWRQRGHRFPRS
jgi:hypothetical protein